MTKEREMIDLLLMEFGDHHYHRCPADHVPEGECNCYAGALCNKARDLLSASIADTAPPTYQDGYQDAWIEPCPNCGHVKGKELDNGEIK